MSLFFNTFPEHIGAFVPLGTFHNNEVETAIPEWL
jgi:hypothetical protein